MQTVTRSRFMELINVNISTFTSSYIHLVNSSPFLFDESLRKRRVRENTISLKRYKFIKILIKFSPNLIINRIFFNVCKINDRHQFVQLLFIMNDPLRVNNVNLFLYRVVILMQESTT